MQMDSDRRRVLIAAGADAIPAFQDLFTRAPLDAWETVPADSFSRARFILQHDPCDVLIVNDDLYESEGSQGLAWLAWQRETPVIFLCGPSAENFAHAYQFGVAACLPRDLALGHPPLLATALDQAIRTAQTRNGYREAKDRLSQARRHVDRLVNIIWRSSAMTSEVQWFSQRYMLERLHEEVARVERHQIPLTLAIGELKAPSENIANGDAMLPDWAMNLVAQGKRRCDIVGQYGMNGFLLLMVHTPIKGGIHCCRRLQKHIEHPEEALAGPHQNLQAYFGVSSTVTGKTSSITLLRSAEENLDEARLAGEERIVVD